MFSQIIPNNLNKRILNLSHDLLTLDLKHDHSLIKKQKSPLNLF